MNNEALKKFKVYFSRIGASDLTLKEIYADDVIFADPIHKISGIQNLETYFLKLNKNVIEGVFIFDEESVVGNRVYLSWEMKLKLKKPNIQIKTSGISVLIIEDKIVYHRDYFDAGELFYENVPILGNIIRWIKRKIVNS